MNGSGAPEFAGYFLTRRRGGAEKDAENAFTGSTSVLGLSSGKVKGRTMRRQRRSHSFGARLNAGVEG